MNMKIENVSKNFLTDNSIVDNATTIVLWLINYSLISYYYNHELLVITHDYSL